MSDKEANPGEIKLYRESPSCYIVRVTETPDDPEMWLYKLKILAILDGYDFKEIGKEFTVSRTKGSGGGMAGWYLFDIDDSYAKDWLKRCNVDLASVI